MSVGKEIKVVLSLDDSGFSVKVRKNQDEVKGLSGQLDSLTKSTGKVESGMADMSKGMSGFANGFSSLSKSLSATVDSLQKSLLGGLNNVNRGIKDTATQAKAAATAQIDAKLKTLQNEVDSNKKLLESRTKVYADLRKLESQMRTQALGAELAADKARRTKKAGTGATATANLNEAARLNANADAVRREADAMGKWIATQQIVQPARERNIAGLENERRAVIANVEAKQQMARVAAAVGKGNDAEIARIRQMAAERETQSAKESARAAAEFARQKKMYATEEARAVAQAEAEKVRVARAAEAERLRLAREAAAERRRIAAQELREQRAQAKMVADMWRGMAQMYGGAKIEGGLKNSAAAADDDQRARIMVQALNLPKDQEARLFADSQKISDQLGFMSTKDVIKSKMSAISSLGYNHEDVIDETLASAIKAANNMELLGAGHGDTQSTLRNIYGVAEMRQQTANPAAMLKTFDVLNKSFVGTAGKVTLPDFENVLRRIGTGARSLSDEGLVNLVGLIDQFKVSGNDGGSGGGVSTVGTIIKMMQAYASGKTKSNKAVQESIAAGVLDDRGLDLSKDDAHVLKDAKNGNFKNLELWMKDPVKAIQDMVPQIVEYTKKHQKEFYQGRDANDIDAQMIAVQSYLQKMGITQSAVTAVTSVGTPAARERLEHQSQTINMADGVDKTAERLADSFAGKKQKFQAQLTNFGVIIGDTILPALTKLLEYGSKVVMMFRDFGQNNPMATTLSTIAAGFGGVVLSVKGFLSMFGTVGVGGVLRSLAGLAPAAAGSVGMIGTAFAALTKVFKTFGLVLIAYDVGTIIGNWLSTFDAFGLMTLTIGDRIDNAITVIIAKWKEMLLNAERVVAKARNIAHIDSDEEYAKKSADINARYGKVVIHEAKTLITPESKQRQPAKLAKRFQPAAQVTDAKDAVNDALAARLNSAVDAAGKKRNDRDPLNAALGEELGKMNAAKTKLDALVAGGETIESLHQQAVDLIEGKRQAGDYSVNHDKTKNPAADSKEIKTLQERTYNAMLYNEQIKAITFANERMAATELEANSAMNALEAGGVAKQTDAFKALSKEMIRAEERLGAGTEAFAKWDVAKTAALYNQARADTTTYALSYVDKNRQAQGALLETEKERIQAGLDAARAAEEEQFKMRQDTLRKTYQLQKSALSTASLSELGIATEQERTDKLTALDGNYQRTRDDTDKVYNNRRKIRAEEEARALESATDKMTREWQDVGKAVDDIGAKAGDGFVSMITNSLSTGRMAVGDFIKGVLMDIANAKLKQTLADPVNGLVSQGTDWLKASVFGMKGEAEQAAAAAATTQRTAADTSATYAASAMSTVINTDVLPALQMMAQSAAQAGGGSAGGFLGSLFGSGAGSGVFSGTTEAGADTIASAMFANGGIMTNLGPVQLRKYAAGGIANSPQLALYGEAGPEAYVPLPDGRSIPVTMKGGQQGGGANVQVNVINQTSTPVNAQQGNARFDGKQMILDVVLSAATTPGSFRSGMKDAMKG